MENTQTKVPTCWIGQATDWAISAGAASDPARRV